MGDRTRKFVHYILEEGRTGRTFGARQGQKNCSVYTKFEMQMARLTGNIGLRRLTDYNWRLRVLYPEMYRQEELKKKESDE